jgi:hypothetical protein
LQTEKFYGVFKNVRQNYKILPSLQNYNVKEFIIIEETGLRERYVLYPAG